MRASELWWCGTGSIEKVVERKLVLTLGGQSEFRTLETLKKRTRYCIVRVSEP